MTFMFFFFFFFSSRRRHTRYIGDWSSDVCTSDLGIVINEPSVVAIDDSSKIVAIGTEAKEMLGRTPDSITASRPLRDGVIADYRITSAMIRHYIAKVSGGFRLSRPDVMVCVPAGATSTERRAVIDAT